MNANASGDTLGATVREFVAGQKLFNRYTLIKILGRGGMGIVWLAHDDELDRDVALKFLPELMIHDRAVLSDLKRETKRSLELTHKNIVRIHDFVHDDQSGCISMEFIDGDTLSNLRSDKEHKVFETDELTQWIGQLCDALDYAHHHARIIHRDLKPANLMVNQRGELKVADFGIARSLSDSMSLLTMDRGTSGTLVFMSPQQLDGERGTHLDDIYSFGASVYELLTSKPPFYSGDIHRQIREKKPPPMSQRRKELEIGGAQIPSEWEKTVEACLEKDPAKRPQSIRDVAVRLNVTPPAAGFTFHPAISSSQRRNLLISATAALIAVAALATWWFSFRAPSRHNGSLQEQPTVSNSPDARTGRLMVNTDPERATVALGDMPRQRTPATFDHLVPGKYPLHISLDGYKPMEREIEIKQSGVTDMGTISLEPASGSIELTSDPVGASVQEGSRNLGMTPLSLKDVRPGIQKLTVSALTYSPKTVEISVEPNRTTTVSVVLAKLPSAPPASVASVPPVEANASGRAKIANASQGGVAEIQGSKNRKFAGTWSGIVSFKDPFVGGGGQQQCDFIVNAEENTVNFRVVSKSGSYHTGTARLTVVGNTASAKGGFLKHISWVITLTGDGTTADVVVHDTVWGSSSGILKKIK